MNLINLKIFNFALLVREHCALALAGHFLF